MFALVSIPMGSTLMSLPVSDMLLWQNGDGLLFGRIYAPERPPLSH